MKRRNKTAFTLMELLVVMAIVVILAGMAIGGAQMARKRGAITKANATIAALEAAIDMYQMDMGECPPSGNASLVQALIENSDSSPDWYGPYMRFKEEDLLSGTYVDPWGNPYFYEAPGTHNESHYDIYSFGPNGQDEQGAGDDVNNW